LLQYYWNTYQSPLQQELWVPVYTMTRCSVLPLLKHVLHYSWNTKPDWTATRILGACVFYDTPILWFPHICNKMWTKPNLQHSETCRREWLMGEILSLDIIRLLELQALTCLLLQLQALTWLPMFQKYVSGHTLTEFVSLHQNNYLLLAACVIWQHICNAGFRWP